MALHTTTGVASATARVCGSLTSSSPQSCNYQIMRLLKFRTPRFDAVPAMLGATDACQSQCPASVLPDPFVVRTAEALISRPI